MSIRSPFQLIFIQLRLHHGSESGQLYSFDYCKIGHMVNFIMFAIVGAGCTWYSQLVRVWRIYCSFHAEMWWQQLPFYSSDYICWSEARGLGTAALTDASKFIEIILQLSSIAKFYIPVSSIVFLESKTLAVWYIYILGVLGQILLRFEHVLRI